MTNVSEKQLETSLKNHGIDASITYNSALGFYSIRFKSTDNHIEIIKCELEHIDKDNILIQLRVNSKVRDTTIKLASGTELYIEEFDVYAFLEMTFSRNKIVSPANLNAELTKEIQAIINDVKQYSV